MKIYISNKVIFFKKIHIIMSGLSIILIFFIVTNMKFVSNHENITLTNNSMGKFSNKIPVVNVNFKLRKEYNFTIKGVTKKKTFNLPQKDRNDKVITFTSVKPSPLLDKKL